MRTKSIGMIKNRRNALNKDGLPAEGSNLRVVYDLFKANKGKVISFSASKPPSNITAIAQLRDYYGCDIRSVKPGKWIFAGEWDGREYISYFEP